MNRLAALIEQLPAHDLKLIQKDLQAGTVDRLVNRRLSALEERKTCATCGRELDRTEQEYALEFGPLDLRQKAWFDGIDCLDHFLGRHRNPPAPDTGRSAAPAGSLHGEDFP